MVEHLRHTTGNLVDDFIDRLKINLNVFRGAYTVCREIIVTSEQSPNTTRNGKFRLVNVKRLERVR